MFGPNFLRSAWKFQRFYLLFTFLKLKNVTTNILFRHQDMANSSFIRHHLRQSSCARVQSGLMFFSSLYLNGFYQIDSDPLDTKICRTGVSFGTNFGNLHALGSNRVWCFSLVYTQMDFIKFILILWTPRYGEYDFHSAPTSEHFMWSDPIGFVISSPYL